MAYKFKKIKKTITLGANPGKKYVAAIAYENTVSKKEVADFIEKDSTIAPADIEILFGALSDAIGENVAIGRGVNMKSLGVFSPNFKSKGEANMDDVSVSNITKVTVNFRPATEFRQDMNKAKVEESTKYKLKHVSQS